MSLTEISIKRPLLISTIFIALILFGIISYMGLNYNLLPSFSAGILNVQTAYPGASPNEIESSITKPIEDAISTVEGINIITSTSAQNISSVKIELKSGVNDIAAQQDVERKINQIKANLPEDANEPVVNRFSTDQFAILNLTMTAKMSDKELFELIDKEIKPQISNVQGVGEISIIGGQEREVEVKLDNEKLQAYKLSPKQVFQIISSSNKTYPAGEVSNQDANVSLKLEASLSNIAALNQLVIKDNGSGSKVLLADIATIDDAQQKVKTLNRNNRNSGIGMQIFKTNDANAVKVSDGVKEKLKGLKTAYASKEFNYDIASDQSIYTLASADAVIHDLFLAILIVGVVMLLFLHSLRSSFFVLIAIPSAMIPTFIVMAAMGFSLNLMTLLGLSLVVGILVDDSIVVLENIFRHLEMGKHKAEAALDGRSEIGFTAVAITLVDVVVFLPMAFTGGLIGNILKEFSVVVVVSTLMSLLVAFTLTPMLASRFGKLEHLSKATAWGRFILSFESQLEQLKDAYGRMLHWVLFHKRYLLILVIALLVGSVMLIPSGFIGASFAGSSDRGELSIKLEMDETTPIYQTNLAIQQAEEMVLKHPEVINAYTLVGTQSSNVGVGSSSAYKGEIAVTMVSKNERDISSDQFATRLRDEIERIPGLQATIIPTGITGSTNSPIQIVIKGPKSEEVFQAALKVKGIVENTAGTDYVRFSTKGVKRQIEIEPDRDLLARMGLTMPDVNQSIQIAFSGNNKTEFTDANANEKYGINVVLDNFDKQSIEDVKKLALSNNKGELVQLYQVASIKEVVGQSVLQRTNRQSSITITSSAVGRPSGNIVADIQKKLAETTLPTGIEVQYQGDAQNQSDAFSSLGLALILAIVLVYMIMVSLYESLIYPFIVIFSVPVALIGALLAIALTMNQLTIFTIIGMIMLLGLVTKNGILIVDFANQLKAEGKELVEALIEAGKERLRPIIMTTFAMILGMLPLALSSSEGSEFKNGMAWAIIGGLTSSFLLTLFLVPTVYYIVDKVQARFSKPQKKMEPSVT
ncbi:MAG: efflux RND transporter permease subunit [Gammaproteobacteria bacterium]|nr:efflux RND transporter permease subunit [Gammaproteobacteria bacterium]